MIKLCLPLLGAFLLSSCGQSQVVSGAITDERRMPQKTCVWSYESDTQIIGIFFGTSYDFIPKVQYISSVSYESAQESIDLLGKCNGDEY